MRIIKQTVILLIFLLIGSSNGYSQNSTETENEINNFVKKNIKEVLIKIPINQEKQFGFNNREEFSKVEIGKALSFVIYNKSSESELHIWRVPIMVDGKYRALLTITKENDKYAIADFGAATLAKDIKQRIDKYPK